MIRIIVTRQGGSDVPMRLAALSLNERLFENVKKTLDCIDDDKDWFVAFIKTSDVQRVKSVAADWAKDRYRINVELHEGEGLVCSYGSLCWFCPYAIYQDGENEGEPCRLGFLET